MTPQRGILVARVSDPRQAREDRYSIEAQFRFMRECCLRRGIEIIDERIEPGTSAFTPDIRQLPVLHQTVLDIEAGVANAPVMHESSRLARNEQLANHLLDRLTACGAAFINTMSDVYYTTPEGRMVFNMEAGMAAYTSRKTAQHSKKGKLEQFLQGLQVGQIPWAYTAQLHPDGRPNRKLPAVQVPFEAEAMRRALLDRPLGRTPNDIAREWNALGFKPRSVRGIERFGPQTVRAMLANPYYMGYVTHLGERRLGLHEPIVSEQEWLAAQRPTARITRRQFPPLLLQGIASCARCGHGIYPARPLKGPKHPGEHYAYYREPSRDFNRECPDAGLLWPSSEPDRLVDELMVSLAMSRDWLAHVFEEAMKLPEDVADRRRELEQTLRRVQKEYFAGRLDDLEYRALRRDYKVELSLLPAARGDLLAALEQFQSFGSLWTPASAEARNDTCRIVFEDIRMDMRSRTLRFCPAAEFEPLFQLRSGLYVTSIPPAPGSP